jgi:hypothetical protein
MVRGAGARRGRLDYHDFDGGRRPYVNARACWALIFLRHGAAEEELGDILRISSVLRRQSPGPYGVRCTARSVVVADECRDVKLFRCFLA